MNNENIHGFIESWGRMGSVWGINNSVARVHALLLVTENPLSLDDIANSLKISRGNASMSLRELKNWGIIKLLKEPGDRQDYYVTESDIWKIFIAISKGRKRREFDPVHEVVRETLGHLKKDSSGAVKKRLTELNDLMATLNAIGERFLQDEDKAKYILAFLSNFVIKGKKK